MKISKQKFTWMGIACAVSLLAGMPAVADDTELLLINPDPTNSPKPNVMFILDSSGSMDTDVQTNAPYDNTIVYDGPSGNDCKSDSLYWTDVDVVPVCDGTSDNYFKKDKFVCEFGQRQIDGIGSFTNTMVMFRKGGLDGDSNAPKWWNFLDADFHDNLVECQADSGKHGDGQAGYLWARSGGDVKNEFTNDPAEEISWGSSPRNISYTVYDGNYLNWKNNPTTVTLQRTEIMKQVTKKVLGSVSNLNVGLMRFHGSDGGAVILDITNLDTNRQAVLDAVDLIPASGNTPLSETLFESALFWRGLGAKYGTTALSALTDTNAFATVDPVEVYEQPDWDVCAKNYNVLLTDGQPTEDFDTPGIIGDLPNYAAALGLLTPSCDGTVLNRGGQCMDDIAEYLSLEDIDPSTDGDQLVTTHTIGFAVNLPILQETASDSGGEYFLANDVESLTKTLLDIIANVNDRTLSFTAPAVSVNTFNRTQNLNDLYVTTFGAKSKAHWPGNLKKYRVVDSKITGADLKAAVDPDTGFFSDDAVSFWTVGTDGNDVILGGAANELPNPLLRNLYTNNFAPDVDNGDLTAGSNHVSPANKNSFTDADFGLTGATGEPTREAVIRWARGEDVTHVDYNAATGTPIRYAMGDPLHSQPATVVYGGTADNPDTVVFAATNDGYLHAINGSTGKELWSFIPKELLNRMTRLFFDPNSKYKQYGIDGNVVPVVKDENRNGIIDGDDFVYLLFGLRRGGVDYYALDVTDKTKPRMLWNFRLVDKDSGESWSTPSVSRMDIDDDKLNDDKAVVVFGGGYDTVHDTAAHPVADEDAVGASVHILDLVSGDELWRAAKDGAKLKLEKMTRAIPNQIRIIDLSGDGFVDRMYASDLGGQIWRFDVFNGEKPNKLVTGGVIAQLGAEGITTPTAADTRRFYNAPDVSIFTDDRQQRRYIAVSIGSGYRSHPYDLSAADRFYSLRDPDVFGKLTQDAYDAYPIIKDSALVEISGKAESIVSATDRGWKFTLPARQKVLADSLTFDDEILFVAFSPDSAAVASCSAGKGTNFLYRMSIVNGDPIVPNLAALADSDADAARTMVLKQGGIAPAPVILFPGPDDKDCVGEACNPEPLRCVGVECTEPGFANNPVRTLWTQDGIE